MNDAPNVPQDIGFLATDVETWLCRAFPCTATTRPTGVADGFLIRETDTGNLMMYNAGGSAWVQVAGSAGGGGGTTGGGELAIPGRWRASGTQSLPNGVDTVVGFGTTDNSSSVVTRATSGPGHKFTLTEAGVFTITATVRIEAGAAGSRFLELRNSAQSAMFVAVGDQGGPAAATRHFSITDKFSVNQELVVVATQSSGATLNTEPGSLGRVRLSIVKISD
jgi:hypothetical protein